MEGLTIVKKIEDMVGYGYLCIRYFPKSERFVMGADIREAMLNMLSIAIGAAKKYHKKTAIQTLDIELQKLKGLVRLAKELGFLSFKRYENWSKFLVEIGKMTGGWLKAVKAS